MKKLLAFAAGSFSLPATGWLIFFKPDSIKYQEVAKYKVADTEVYAHPVIAGNIKSFRFAL